MMAKRLVDNGLEIDLMVSSTAVRAITTAQYFKTAFQLPNEKFLSLTALYHADVQTCNEIISIQNDTANVMAIFSHNPGITYLANSMGVMQLDNMPTCGIFAVHGHCNSWVEFENSKKEFWFFDYPKL